MNPESVFCPNIDCPARGRRGASNISVHSQKEQRYYCDVCQRSFAATKGTIFYRLRTDPKVVILDEATSALDTSTETRLHGALGEFLDGRTTLIIAHRLSAVKQADRVYVFEDGHIIEEGAHEELIKANGLYARLYGKAQH